MKARVRQSVAACLMDVSLFLARLLRRLAGSPVFGCKRQVIFRDGHGRGGSSTVEG